MQIDLQGRVALITGGSKGLGLATAKRFVGAGADIAIVARDPEGLAAAREELAALNGPGRIGTFVCDVTNGSEIAAAHSQIVDAYGQVDILVSNAGTHAHDDFLALGDKDWQADLDLKLFASIRFARHVLPGMQERRWGRIINVVNVFAKAPGPRTAPTSVSRAAQVALTKVLAGEGAPYNVLVNAIAVGVIRSEQIERNYETVRETMSFEEFGARLAKRLNIPAGRLGVPEEFAGVACFLASDAASYVTGSVINVDGGMCPVV